MTAILVEPTISDDVRRSRVFDGQVVTYAPRPSVERLCDLAWTMAVEAFAPLDPAEAQRHLPVERFVDVLAALKPAFTHARGAKEILRDVLEDFGCDPQMTHFDLPKLRVVTSDGYLTSGLGYAYAPHRDTWYSAPPSQVNWWTPISGVDVASCMTFYTDYWDRAVENSSDAFDAYEWNANGRANAREYVHGDDRNHPRAWLGDRVATMEVVGDRGSMLIFSAAQLHGTVPNTSGTTRFSVDFRTVHLDDLRRRRGAANLDSASTGTTLRDFHRATDFEKLPAEVIASYETGPVPDEGAALVYEPDGDPGRS